MSEEEQRVLEAAKAWAQEGVDLGYDQESRTDASRALFIAVLNTEWQPRKDRTSEEVVQELIETEMSSPWSVPPGVLANDIIDALRREGRLKDE